MNAPRFWSDLNPVSLALAPLAFVYCLVARARAAAYRRGWLRVARLPVTTVVVGNLSVGGTGKTPLVIALARDLRARGFAPGIVARGYRAARGPFPRAVTPSTPAGEGGDEPVLLARATGCPVFIGPDRPAAARALLAAHRCDVLLSDDGLQHYRLARDVEIAVIDGRRRHGNGLCLPAGPLREPVSRLARVDLRVLQGEPRAGERRLSLRPVDAVDVRDGARSRPFSAFTGRVHAVAGVGNPARFFDMLRGLGLEIMEHPFPDHHRFRPNDLRFDDGNSVIMTEKDAVKCAPFVPDDAWYLRVRPEVDPSVIDFIAEKIRKGTYG